MDDRIQDESITRRAIARKRSGFGWALGDIVLSDGRSVEMLAAEVLTRALREAGLRVLVPGNPGYDQAPPIDAELVQWLHLESLRR